MSGSLRSFKVTGGLRSTKRAMQDAIKTKKTEMPNDFGLAPQTLICPPKEAMPPWTRKTLTKRLKAQFYVTMLPISDWMRYYFVKRGYADSVQQGKWWRQPYMLSERYSIARRLHQELFTALAAGDKTSVSRLTANGLSRELVNIIDNRERAGLPKQTWSVKYEGWTPKWDESNAKGLWPWMQQAFRPPPWKSVRIISDKYMPVPIVSGSSAFLRQIVAEIKSTQTLSTKDSTKKEFKKEYFVCQQMSFGGESQPWRVWGTVKPSNAEDVEEFLTAASGASKKVTDTWTDSAAKLLSGNSASM